MEDYSIQTLSLNAEFFQAKPAFFLRIGPKNIPVVVKILKSYCNWIEHEQRNPKLPKPRPKHQNWYALGVRNRLVDSGTDGAIGR